MKQFQDPVLLRIKRTLIAGAYRFTEKAELELLTDSLTQLDAIEAVLKRCCDHKNNQIAQSLCDSSWRAAVRD
jgi:hypothetical protein